MIATTANAVWVRNVNLAWSEWGQRTVGVVLNKMDNANLLDIVILQN